MKKVIYILIPVFLLFGVSSQVLAEKNITAPKQMLYVTLANENAVEVIDAVTGLETALIPVGQYPTNIVFRPHTSLAYVTNFNSSSVSVINTITNTEQTRFTVGTDPDGIVFSHDGKYAYISHQWSDANSDWSGGITVIDAQQLRVIKEISGNGRPRGMAITSNDGKVYVANFGSGTVSVIDTATNSITSTITGGSAPVSISISESLAYVANYNGGNLGTVSVINTRKNQIISTIQVGKGPMPIANSVEFDSVYVGNSGSNSITAINQTNNTVVTTIPSIQDPSALAFDGKGRYLFAVNFDAVGTITKIDVLTNQVVGTMSTHQYPGGIAVSN
ncbi:YncE family protein [Candidatus Kaiserbacteria bacterium]|nr:YncE family protein [Candidatus Kaiserbacteria bacterium]